MRIRGIESATGPIFVFMVVLLLIFLTTGSQDREFSSQSPTATPTDQVPTPDWPDPIFSENEAISRTLEIFPINATYTNIDTRLVSWYTFVLWSEYGDVTTGPPASEINFGGASPDDPVWIVGISGNNIVVKDIIEAVSVMEAHDQRIVPGAYYAWDARSGNLLAAAGFLDTSPQNQLSFGALPTEAIPITPAPSFPTEAIKTPQPSPTWRPADWATAVAVATWIAQITPTATP